jgi:hypothetical protein
LDPLHKKTVDEMVTFLYNFQKEKWFNTWDTKEATDNLNKFKRAIYSDALIGTGIYKSAIYRYALLEFAKGMYYQQQKIEIQAPKETRYNYESGYLVNAFLSYLDT